MFHRRSIVPLMAVALVCVIGCSTPMEKAHTVSSMYAQAQQDIIQQRQMRLIDDNTFNTLADADKEITPLIHEMNRSAIQAEQESVPWTKTFNFNSIYDRARAKVNEFLLRWATAKEGRNAPEVPVLQPVNQ
jgi:hypothetical protein